ncbi:MAG TPA: hypothetical protein PKA00_16175, partial [Saprospiraceae bacterium]|nr:hypothetical protein [Saprospiraceae bacterium]HMQ84452.1 hypothetical protein [Saprospiraceae bacterium]
ICHSVPVKHCKTGKYKDFFVSFPYLRLSTPEPRSGDKIPVEDGRLYLLKFFSPLCALCFFLAPVRTAEVYRHQRDHLAQIDLVGQAGQATA